jgi:hypothetical protein
LFRGCRFFDQLRIVLGFFQCGLRGGQLFGGEFGSLRRLHGEFVRQGEFRFVRGDDLLGGGLFAGGFRLLVGRGFQGCGLIDDAFIGGGFRIRRFLGRLIGGGQRLIGLGFGFGGGIGCFRIAAIVHRRLAGHAHRIGSGSDVRRDEQPLPFAVGPLGDRFHVQRQILGISEDRHGDRFIETPFDDFRRQEHLAALRHRQIHRLIQELQTGTFHD